MNTPWTLCLVFTACLAADKPADDAVEKAALANLQGRWQLTRHEHGGKAMPAKGVAELGMEVNGARMVVRERGEVKEESAIVSLRPRAKPAQIDVKITSGTDRDKVARGILKLEGDTLSVCVAEPGKDRPAEFAGKVGTGHTLLVFTRVKKK